MCKDATGGWTAARRAGFGAAVLFLGLACPAGAQGGGGTAGNKHMHWGKGSLILFDRLEYAPDAEGDALSVDVTGWYGGAYDRLWYRADVEQPTVGNGGEGEAELFYGRLVTPYWDALAGVRVDQQWGGEGKRRAHLAVGFIGLAPNRFELSPTLYLSQDGDLSARLEAEYQLLVTQQLVAEPELELNAALQEVPEFGVGRGLNDVELGLRFRYEFTRKFAPYVGYTWTRRFGGSAGFAREDGESVSDGSLVAGLRIWR